MLRYTVWKVENEEYKLRLTASAILAAEKRLGKSIFTALQEMEENLLETVTVVLWAAMQPLNHGITQEQVYALYDAYIDEGHSMEDLLLVVTQLFEASGFFKAGQGEKNPA